MEIVLVFGKICSGKDYFCNQLTETFGFPVITISSILRKITGLTKRSELLITEDLKENIFEELKKEIDNKEKIIINGIRQIEVMEYLLEEYKDVKKTMFWLYCDDEIRKKRFEDRSSNKDDITFEIASERDDKMGLSKIYEKYEDKMIKVNMN